MPAIDFVEEKKLDFRESKPIDFQPEGEAYLSTDITPSPITSARISSTDLAKLPRSSEELAGQTFQRSLQALGAGAMTGPSGSTWKNLTEALDLFPDLKGKTVADAMDVIIAHTMDPEAGPQVQALKEEILASKSREPTEAEKIAAGTVNTVTEAVESFTSPLGIATLGLGALPKAAQLTAAGIFAAHMGSALPEQTKQAVTALKAGDTEAAAKAISGVALTATFAGLAGKHAVTGAKELMVERAKEVGPATEAAIEGKKPVVTPAPEPAVPPATVTGEISKPAAVESPAVAEPSLPPDTIRDKVAQAKVKRVEERPHDIIDELEGNIGGKLSLTKARKMIEGYTPTGAARKLFSSAGYAPDVAAQAVGFKGGDVALLEAIQKAADARKGLRAAKREEAQQQPALVGLGAATPAEYEITPKTPTGIRNSTVDQERATRGLPPAMQPARRSFGEVWDRTMAKIDQDPSYTDRLLEELRKQPRALTDIEDAAILHRQIELQNEYGKATRDLAQAYDDGRMEDVDAEKIRVVDLSDRLLDLYDVGKAAGTETGRGLAARKMLAYEDFSLAKMEIEKRAAKGGAPLTDAERAEVMAAQKKIEETQKALDERIASADERTAGQQVDTAINEIKKQKPSEVDVPIADQQKALALAIGERIKANKLDAVTPLVQKLARLFVEQGVKGRNELIDAVHAVLKEINPEITRRQTMDAISGYGQFKRLSKDEISKELRDLKGQMQQVAKLEDMQASKPPLKTGMERRKPSDEERRLIRLVNEAKNKFQIPSTDKETQLQSSLDTLKTKLRNRISDLTDRLARKDFETKPKRIVQMDEEANKLHFKATQAKIEWQKALLRDQRARRSLPRKIFDRIGETVNLARVLMTSGEFSGVLRQGGFIGIGNPVRLARALPAMFRAFRSEAKQHAVNMEIMSRPNYPLYQRSKLYLSEHGGKLSQMEEQYMSSWAEKIPFVAGTQRAYSTFLNKLRADSFDTMARTLVRRTGELTPERGSAIANFINVATGRGNLAAKEGTLVGLNTYFFAPRWVASRLQLAVGQPFWRLDKQAGFVVRGDKHTVRLVAEEYGKFLVGMGVIYGLWRTAGGQIGDDPRSTDFGKFIIGNTRVDLMAGLQQQTVLMSRLASGEQVKRSGAVVPVRGNVPYGSSDSASLLGKFLRQKLAPIPASAIDLLTGKDVADQPVTLESELMQLSTPLTYQDIYKAMQDQGVPEGTILALLAIFGAGVNTQK